MSYAPPAVEDLGSLEELTNADPKPGNVPDMFSTVTGSMFSG